MQPRERCLAERRTQAWKDFFGGKQHSPLHQAPIDDISLFVRYIDYLKDHPQRDTLHIPSLALGGFIGGVLVFTAFLIFG